MYKLKYISTALRSKTKLIQRQLHNEACVMSSEAINKHKVHHVRSSQTLQIAHQCLLRGEVIALPTDTVYGLTCDANNELAIQQLYAIKGRDDHKPVAICVPDLGSLRRYGRAEHLSNELLEQLLPGPITIVIEKSSQLSNRFLNPTTNLIGIRIPDFWFIQKLCALFKEQPLALTSANRSGEPSSLSVQEFSCLWQDLGAVCDTGQLGLSEMQRSASSVIDLATPGYYRVVREGIAFKRTLQVLDKFNLKSISVEHNNDKDQTLITY